MQHHRLVSGGVIDRKQELTFTFNGRRLKGYEGDNLASALLANNICLIARSIKYHRPRGILAAGLEDPCALVSCRDSEGVFIPNLKATEIHLREGLEARSQNCWPGISFDIGGLLQRISTLLSAGFYYKTFMWPATGWHRIYAKLIRRVAGQGRAPNQPDSKRYDKRTAHCDLLIVGSGPAGLSAALAAGETGISVILLEQDRHLGGSALWEQSPIESLAAELWLNNTLESLEQCDNIRIMNKTLAFGQYDHGQVMAVERETDSTDSIFWRIRARRILLACGATQQPLVFANNDRPGIMLAAAVRQYIYRYAVAPGSIAFLAVTDQGELELTRDALNYIGVKIAGSLQDGERIINTRGRHRVAGVECIDRQGSRRVLDCDLLCVSAGWNPNAQLVAQLGNCLNYDTEANAQLPPAQLGVTFTSGACRGIGPVDDCVIDGRQQGLQAIDQIKGRPGQQTTLLKASAQIRDRYYQDHNKNVFIDLQNDVTRADLEQTVLEGYQHVELAKRYTTLGMGTDQGKTSWINGIREIGRITNTTADRIGHTTFRPPCSPVSIGALVGADVNQYLAPIRQTPFHREFTKAGCVFQTSGDWMYARYFPQHDESMEQAIQREVKAVRSAVGCVDMSTLGKVDIKGEDAAEFISRIYCNDLNTLEPGRLRYALMLREDGIVFDDGTVAQLDHNHYLATMTTANAASVWRWMNKLLQLQWPELDVQLTSVSDHWASLAIAGPESRSLLARLNPDFEIDRQSFPFASIREGVLDGKLPCRVYNVSFSGELSYEINIPAGFAANLYQMVTGYGTELGLTIYGLETLDVLRIEKGHLSIGTEIDGRTTPTDLGLAKMVSNRKSFMGSSLLQRPALNNQDRWQLAGLVPADGHSVIPPAAHLCTQAWQPGNTASTQGKLTATVVSPTLGHSIALALLENGQQRLHEKLWAVSPLLQQSVEVIVTPHCFVDPEGHRVRG